MIFQGDSIFPWMTVYDNAAYGLRMRNVPAAEIDEVVGHFLERTGLTKFAKAYPHQLSGGMKQRVSIARAFANDPEVLLMDEPFSALDEQNKTLLQEELLRIWEETKKTVLFITHSVDEAVTLGDKIMVMTAQPGRAKAIIDVPVPAPAQGAGVACHARIRRAGLRHLGTAARRGAGRQSGRSGRSRGGVAMIAPAEVEGADAIVIRGTRNAQARAFARQHTSA